MAMPAPSKNYYGLANLALASVASVAAAANSYIHAKIKTLKGQNHTAFPNFGAIVAGAFSAVRPPSSAYWTVVSSSNGTVAGAGDNFNNTFNNAEFPNSAAGARMWCQLQSPAGMLDGPWYMLIAKDNASATTWTVAYSKTQWTGGTTTANPTNAGNVSSQSLAHFNTASVVAGKVHCLLDANGSFYFYCSRDGSGLIETWDIWQQLEQNQPTGDAYRCIGYSGHNTAGIFSQVNQGSNINGTGVFGFHRNGVATASSNLVIGVVNISGLTELNGINSDAEPIKSGHVYSTLASNQCIRGFVPDFYQVTSALTNASNHENNVTPKWSAFGSASTGGKVAQPFPCTLSL